MGSSNSSHIKPTTQASQIADMVENELHVLYEESRNKNKQLRRDKKRLVTTCRELEQLERSMVRLSKISAALEQERESKGSEARALMEKLKRTYPNWEKTCKEELPKTYRKWQEAKDPKKIKMVIRQILIKQRALMLCYAHAQLHLLMLETKSTKTLSEKEKESRKPMGEFKFKKKKGDKTPFNIAPLNFPVPESSNVINLSLMANGTPV